MDFGYWLDPHFSQCLIIQQKYLLLPVQWFDDYWVSCANQLLSFFLLQYGYLWTRPHQPLLPTSLADSLAGENKVRMNTENEFVFYPLGKLPLPGLGLAVWLVSGRSLCFLVLIVLSLFWEQKGFGFCWCQSDSFLEALNSIKKNKILMVCFTLIFTFVMWWFSFSFSLFNFSSFFFFFEWIWFDHPHVSSKSISDLRTAWLLQVLPLNFQL